MHTWRPAVRRCIAYRYGDVLRRSVRESACDQLTKVVALAARVTGIVSVHGRTRERSFN